MEIRTRFAPSSTGDLHIGSVRTAFYSWLFSKCFNGIFILRIEDTDIVRSNSIYVKNILETLRWLDIDWDKGPYFQSQRLSLYKEKINEMLEIGVAYKCYCTVDRLKKIRLLQILHGKKPKYDQKCRNIPLNKQGSDNYVIRFKNPNWGKVVFSDIIRGTIVFNNSELDDLIIQRQNGLPTYNFCSIIDDLEMKITHVIRGEDHINNTPRQINILKSLGSNIPIYTHVSMVVDDKKNNLSKRKNACSILQYKKEGFFKESVLNYLFKLGWSYNNQEFYSLTDMKKIFSLKMLNKSPSTFSIKKLLWFNQYYLNVLPIDDYLINNFKMFLHVPKILLQDRFKLARIIKLFRKRGKTLKEIALQSHFFFCDIKINKDLINKYLFPNYKKIFIMIYCDLFYIDHWNHINIMMVIKNISVRFRLSNHHICMPLRIFMTGVDVSPNISIIMDIIGKRESLKRIKKLLYYSNM
ncbi:glutamate--tRNA ligase [Buchnera aphidicola]|uniref:Glutamate--tRNA ligase n=1 Tax=Buchnera aphidicola (Stegophylla sp.) TaxID=2315800 RepID=A0A4D6YKT3_9GAMM|nr:glutamate--tRNA ligase [Buchnera aphidicola (Stegophylla sp.)]QCI26248.1 glutamate--tRNA ligase [Buchnera aphidicola (Stegophylla sp.)]